MWNKRQRGVIAAILSLACCGAYLSRRSIASTRSLIFSEFDVPTILLGGDASTTTTSRGHGPPAYYANLWRRRFSSRSGFIFFKHIRKAGGTAIREYLHAVMEYHGQATFRQFLKNHDRKETRRHSPFLNSAQKQLAERYYNQRMNKTTTVASRTHNKYKVHYIEQEFSSMDWKCRHIDPRWNDSLSVVSLRHPIERHLSEFFYSGAGEFEGRRFDGFTTKLRMDRTKLYANRTYTHALSVFLMEHLPPWAKTRETPGNYFPWYFGRHYVRDMCASCFRYCAEETSVVVFHAWRLL